MSASNSIVGSGSGNNVGSGGVTALANGNYVVVSTEWSNNLVRVGAVSFGNGTTGTSGAVSAANSLIGSTAGDSVGSGGVTALTNGNYVVVSRTWDGSSADAGAVTFGDGTTGIVGAVTAANSLVGSTENDQLGNPGVMALTNGNYVVNSIFWDNDTVPDVGAITFGDGTNGITGTVSVSNSLIGSTAFDRIGGGRITVLTNGNYVVASPNWRGTVVNAGAVTFGDGTNGTIGVISAANSLVGSTAEDQVGLPGVKALTNGNYVVNSSFWDGTVVNAGAVTFGNGTSGISGTISAANSLVGSTAFDSIGFIIGFDGIKPLNNGNYVVLTPFWDGAAANVGAVTFGNGTTGTAGIVSAANSLVGSTAEDQVGALGVTALPNSNYVVNTSAWDNGAITDVGAVTFGNGTTGTSGAVSAANSLIGSTANDVVGSNGVFALPNGNYAVRSLYWDNGAIVDAGAVTYLSGETGTNPPSGIAGFSTKNSKFSQSEGNELMITMSNSVLGTVAGLIGGATLSFDSANNQLVIGNRKENKVTLFGGLAPVTVTISGRVTDGFRGIGNAVVSFTDFNGNPRTTRTNSFGFFSFDNVELGQTYTFNVSARRYQFASQMVLIDQERSNLVFMAQ